MSLIHADIMMQFLCHILSLSLYVSHNVILFSVRRTGSENIYKCNTKMVTWEIKHLLWDF